MTFRKAFRVPELNVIFAGVVEESRASSHLMLRTSIFGIHYFRHPYSMLLNGSLKAQH